ncbi:MAG: hypothetical protein HYW26_01365 [Candidatus Aenigmarchaeota archaeon]|nr:hypothetical protein [Candidatus Aenigmarchaeota archaeon]
MKQIKKVLEGIEKVEGEVGTIGPIPKGNLKVTWKKPVKVKKHKKLGRIVRRHLRRKPRRRRLRI